MRHGDKLYIVARADLLPGPRAVQAIHAAQEFVHQHPEVDLEWYEVSNHLAFLEVPDEAALHRLVERARLKGLAVAVFREPDLDNRVTAIALEPAAKNLCRGLPLALADAA